MIKAKKRFGQNFLKDDFVLDKIKRAIPTNDNVLVEIGPGMGDLTNKLLQTNKKVIAYEIDRDLFALLQKKFCSEINSLALDINQGDVLEHWDNNSSLCDSKYDLVANLPYNIGTKIVLKALEDDNCENIIVMLQLEVAKKFLSSSGASEFCALGVISDLACAERSEVVFVDKASFDPQPKVDSMVICLAKNTTKAKQAISNEFKLFLRLCFQAPRKKIFSSLKSRYDAKQILDVFASFDIGENARAHEIESKKYMQMFASLHKLA